MTVERVSIRAQESPCQKEECRTKMITLGLEVDHAEGTLSRRVHLHPTNDALVCALLGKLSGKRVRCSARVVHIGGHARMEAECGHAALRGDGHGNACSRPEKPRRGALPCGCGARRGLALILSCKGGHQAIHASLHLLIGIDTLKPSRVRNIPVDPIAREAQRKAEIPQGIWRMKLPINGD